MKAPQSLILASFALVPTADEETVTKDVENNAKRVCCLIDRGGRMM